MVERSIAASARHGASSAPCEPSTANDKPLLVLEQLQERLLRLLLAFEELTVQWAVCSASRSSATRFSCACSRATDSPGSGPVRVRSMRQAIRTKFPAGRAQGSEGACGLAVRRGVSSFPRADWIHGPIDLDAISWSEMRSALPGFVAYDRELGSRRHRRRSWSSNSARIAARVLRSADRRSHLGPGIGAADLHGKPGFLASSPRL